jgi:hypothetical protein
MIETAEMRKILSMLVRKTAEGTIEWREGAEEEYMVSFPQSSLVLAAGVNKASGNSFTVLSALNASGDRVGHLHSAVSFEDAHTLAKLYKDVVHRANRVDETFNDILQGLGGSKNRN